MPTKSRNLPKANLVQAFAFGPIIYASDDSSARIVVTVRISPQGTDLINHILSGKSRGLSPDVKVDHWECSVCHQDYEKCSHRIDFLYDGVRCQVIAKGIEFTGGSVVDVPKDSRCRVTDMLLVGKIDNKRKCYEWRGFEINSEFDRFDSIQAALKQKLIPEEAAFKFSEFFSVTLFGKCQYP